MKLKYLNLLFALKSDKIDAEVHLKLTTNLPLIELNIETEQIETLKGVNTW